MLSIKNIRGMQITCIYLVKKDDSEARLTYFSIAIVNSS